MKSPYGDFVKEVVVRPDFFVSGDHLKLKDMEKAEDYWRAFWKEMAEDLGQDVYVFWGTGRQPSGGPHHHAIVSFQFPEKIRVQKRMFGKLAKSKNREKELVSFITKRWEKGWDRNKGYGTVKRGSMSFMRYEADLDGVQYIVNHMKQWITGEVEAGHSSVSDGYVYDQVFCGKSNTCRKHYKKHGMCKNAGNGVFYKRIKK